MAVVTLSGQIGSGAREVGRAAAARLQIDYVDQEILVQAARTLGVSLESVATKDERTAGLGERLATMLRRFLERSAAAGAADPMLGNGGLDVLLGRTYAEAAAEEPQEIADDRYQAALCDIIREVASHDDVVIIGRGSQVILKELPGALHVLLVGPLDARVESIAGRDGISREDAAKRVGDGDKGRAAFHRKFFKINADDPSLYHLTLNTGRLTIDQATGAIAHAARSLPSGR